MLVLPFTADQDEDVRLFRIAAAAADGVPGYRGAIPQKTMEIRFFAPGSLVSNLDFVESIFGNAGDPYLPENDAALDVMHWTGHTGCVILAPHLVGMKKKDLGLPHAKRGHRAPDAATGCAGADAEELYNNGGAFKVSLPRPARRDGHHHRGQLLRLLQERSEDADQLRGQPVRAVRGGARRAAPSLSPTYVLGQEFHAGRTRQPEKSGVHGCDAAAGDLVRAKPEGYAMDRRYPDIFYVPEDSVFDVLRREHCLAEERWAASG